MARASAIAVGCRSRSAAGHDVHGRIASASLSAMNRLKSSSHQACSARNLSKAACWTAVALAENRVKARVSSASRGVMSWSKSATSAGSASRGPRSSGDSQPSWTRRAGLTSSGLPAMAEKH